MDSSPAKHKLSGLIPVARFFSPEEAAEFSQMAADAGILAVIADLTRVSPQFDGSLGGFTASEGHTVYVSPDDVPKLCQTLEDALTVDPLDPLCALSNAELRGILETPLHSNLTEWALARKLLATRGPEEDPIRTGTEIENWAQDPRASSDLRLARWLGTVVLISFASGVILSALAFAGGFAEKASQEEVFQSAQKSLSAAAPVDQFSEALRILMIPVVMTLTSTIVLISAWRTLANGTWRWMFPPIWRAVAWWTLILTAGALVTGLIVEIVNAVRSFPPSAPTSASP